MKIELVFVATGADKFESLTGELLQDGPLRTATGCTAIACNADGRIGDQMASSGCAILVEVDKRCPHGRDPFCTRYFLAFHDNAAAIEQPCRSLKVTGVECVGIACKQGRDFDRGRGHRFVRHMRSMIVTLADSAKGIPGCVKP